MFFPFLVILPGLIAVSMGSHVTGAAPAAIRQRPPASGAAAAPSDLAHPHGIVPVKTDPSTGAPMVDSDGQPSYNYDLTIPVMLLHFFRRASSASDSLRCWPALCRAWRATLPAFNAVWTYDIYQAYINKKGSDAHYLWMGRMATIGGVVLSVAAAYAVTSFNNIMDALQLVFALVNAPLFATFLLGMFWKRTTGHGAFAGLTLGTVGAFIHHGLTLPLGDAAGIHGGWIHVVHQYPSDMAQNFWTAIFAFSINFVVTVVVSLMTSPRPESELVGLVYSLTPKPVPNIICSGIRSRRRWP